MRGSERGKSLKVRALTRHARGMPLVADTPARHVALYLTHLASGWKRSVCRVESEALETLF